MLRWWRWKGNRCCCYDYGCEQETDAVATMMEVNRKQMLLVWWWRWIRNRCCCYDDVGEQEIFAVATMMEVNRKYMLLLRWWRWTDNRCFCYYDECEQETGAVATSAVICTYLSSSAVLCICLPLLSSVPVYLFYHLFLSFFAIICSCLPLLPSVLFPVHIHHRSNSICFLFASIIIATASVSCSPPSS